MILLMCHIYWIKLVLFYIKWTKAANILNPVLPFKKMHEYLHLNCKQAIMPKVQSSAYFYHETMNTSCILLFINAHTYGMPTIIHIKTDAIPNNVDTTPLVSHTQSFMTTQIQCTPSVQFAELEQFCCSSKLFW